ncbi:hypothetical protein K503DRAFT_765114 [Rhizopogon vinicolor AM-OR11-026]|uniref:Uncharacterized protein n=1 Tax=Rhizopogon vinicolor AM-OR11-026 TaxID=1314800 RepID=A0A1B7NHD6_9AGAM|nr:hypothetical protein K503DRAFT_765114 [Rhizopogon vinicolor AM-OR11-026]
MATLKLLSFPVFAIWPLICLLLLVGASPILTSSEDITLRFRDIAADDTVPVTVSTVWRARRD